VWASPADLVERGAATEELALQVCSGRFDFREFDGGRRDLIELKTLQLLELSQFFIEVLRNRPYQIGLAGQDSRDQCTGRCHTRGGSEETDCDREGKGQEIGTDSDIEDDTL
jgi:hypothetical protein